MSASAALTRAAGFGSYFEVDLAGDVPDFDVDTALAAVCRRLGTTELRVAASSMQYEFAERLWAVSLGAWVCGRVIPDLAGLRYGAREDGRLVLGLAAVRALDCGYGSSAEVADTLSDNVIGHLHVFHQTLRTATRVADGLLWGNAATALALSARSAGLGPRGHAIASALLARAPLAGRLVGPISAARRRSCCLFYRTAAARTCGDCPLSKVPG